MDNSSDYFLFISVNDLKNIMMISKRIRNLYTSGILLCICLGIYWVFGIKYIIEGNLPMKFGGGLGIVIITPLVVEFLRGFIIEWRKYKNLIDLWVDEKGINYPLPISMKEREHFIRFQDIEKIEIWTSPDIERKLSTILIYLKKPYKTDFVFQNPRQVRLYIKDYEEFYNAIYRATNGKLLVIIKGGR